MFGITTSNSAGQPLLDARQDFGRPRRSRRTAGALPPITLGRRLDGRYVIDGCQRVSVVCARAPRHRLLRPARGRSR